MIIKSGAKAQESVNEIYFDETTKNIQLQISDERTHWSRIKIVKQFIKETFYQLNILRLSEAAFGRNSFIYPNDKLQVNIS